jgi:hypothetical protein
MDKLIYNKPFRTETGALLPELEIAFNTWGNLNSRGDNVIWICHALTANSDVESWWPGMVGKELFLSPIDLRRWVDTRDAMVVDVELQFADIAFAGPCPIRLVEVGSSRQSVAAVSHASAATFGHEDGMRGPDGDVFERDGSGVTLLRSTKARPAAAQVEQCAAIDAPLRESIIERALALPDDEISLDRFKIVVLAMIWRTRHEVDALILEEILAEEVDEADLDIGEHVTRILLN